MRAMGFRGSGSDHVNRIKDSLFIECCQGRPEKITEWIEREIFDSRSGIEASLRKSFFLAQRMLLTEFIRGSDFNGVVILMQAIDSDTFDKKFEEYNHDLSRFRSYQCGLLARAIIDSERVLKTDTLIHASLRRMLYNRCRKQLKFDWADWEHLNPDQITLALRIVQFKNPSRIFEPFLTRSWMIKRQQRRDFPARRRRSIDDYFPSLPPKVPRRSLEPPTDLVTLPRVNEIDDPLREINLNLVEASCPRIKKSSDEDESSDEDSSDDSDSYDGDTDSGSDSDEEEEDVYAALYDDYPTESAASDEEEIDVRRPRIDGGAVALRPSGDTRDPQETRGNDCAMMSSASCEGNTDIQNQQIDDSGRPSEEGTTVRDQEESFDYMDEGFSFELEESDVPGSSSGSDEEERAKMQRIQNGAGVAKQSDTDQCAQDKASIVNGEGPEQAMETGRAEPRSVDSTPENQDKEPERNDNSDFDDFSCVLM